MSCERCQGLESRLDEVERERDEARRTAEQRKESNAHNYAMREAATARADALAGLLATARDHWHEDDARLGPCDLCRAVARVDAAGPADGGRA